MKFHLSPIAAAAVALCAQPATAEQQQVVAASPLTQVTALPDVTVDGSTVSPYKADAVQSPKFTQPLRETPQTIQIITSEVFTQQGATTLTEALRNSPGVGTFYAGENGNTTTGDAIYMRGFDTSNSIFVDGIRDLGSISRDVFNIEQIEVIKGPAGTDYGRTAPTGSVNLATKQAHLGNAVSGLVSVGSDGQRRAQADLNQTIGDRVFFDTDQYNLRPDARATVDRWAAWLQQYPNVVVTIEGHADERGTREYNYSLGARRGQTVRDYLASRGIAPNRMRTISYGKERPVAVCNDISCWSQNRRSVTVLDGAGGAPGV